jgi:phosphoglycerate dehydrogenase-like enzyme
MTRHRTLFVTRRGLRHQQAALDAAPPELDVTVRRTTDMREILPLLADTEFLVSERTGAIDAEVIAAGRKLRLIQRLGSQVWDIDAAAAKRAGVPVCYWPVTTCILVAEHAILLMLALGRRLRELVKITDEAGDWGLPPKRCSEDYFAFNWSRREHQGAFLGATVGILGFGEIGTELARRLKDFGCTLLYTKRQRLPPAVEAELGLAYAPRDELAERSDYVSCLLPNLPENNQSVDATFFGRAKRGACFVHVGAPGTVNETDLIAALRAGRLGGAAIDCYTYEPLRPDDPLLELARNPAANLILTPHVAAGTVAANREERVRDYSNLLAVLRGEPLLHRLT